MLEDGAWVTAAEGELANITDERTGDTPVTFDSAVTTDKIRLKATCFSLPQWE